MKEIYRKEEGVSPVIATILMVAITVVLAATVYIMVAGMGGGGSSVIGNLNYMASDSSSTVAKFQIQISQPNNPLESTVTVKVLNSNDTVVYETDGSSNDANLAVTWIHISSDSTHVTSGDQLKITLDTSQGGSVSSLSNLKVYVTVTGYDGNVVGSVPS